MELFLALHNTGACMAIYILVAYVAIIIISLREIASDIFPYSLNKIFWIYCFLFMGLAPMFQYITGTIPWGGTISERTYLGANLVILLCCFTYKYTRQLMSKKYEQGKGVSIAIQYPGCSDLQLKRYRFQGNIVFLCCCLLLILITGIEHLFQREGAQQLIAGSSLQLLFDKTLRGAILYFLFISIILFRQQKIGLVQLLLVLSLTVLTHFPSGVSRYLVAVFYIGMMLTAGLPVFFRYRHFFSNALIVLILLVFPVLSICRYTRAQIKLRFHDTADIFRFSFSAGDFDAYSLFCKTIDHCHVYGISMGRQLLTVVLFFVPRTWWPSKSIGSGGIVNRSSGSDFVNYSSPVFAEGYINFGCCGSVLFTALFAIAAFLYDRYYWRPHEQLQYRFIFYPAALSMAFYILRGDLLSSVAYTTGLFVSGFFFHSLLRGSLCLSLFPGLSRKS